MLHTKSADLSYERRNDLGVRQSSAAQGQVTVAVLAVVVHMDMADVPFECVEPYGKRVFSVAPGMSEIQTDAEIRMIYQGAHLGERGGIAVQHIFHTDGDTGLSVQKAVPEFCHPLRPALQVVNRGDHAAVIHDPGRSQ